MTRIAPLYTVLRVAFVLIGVALSSLAHATDGPAEFERQWLLVLDDPDDAQRYQQMLSIAYGEGMLPELASRLRALSESQPSNSILLHTLGYALSTDGKHQEAESVWLRAFDLDPAGYGPTRELARMYLRDARPEVAMMVLAKHFDAASGRGRPPPAHLLTVAGDVVVALATKGGRPSSDVRRATDRVLEGYVVALSLPTFMPLMPDRDSYRDIPVPDGAKHIEPRAWLAVSSSPSLVVDLLSQFAQASLRDQRLEQAGDYFRAANDLARESKLGAKAISAGGNLANYLDHVGQFAEAAKAFEGVLEMAKVLPTPDDAARVWTAHSYYNAASTLLRLGKIAKSFLYAYKAIELYGQEELKPGSALDNLHRASTSLINRHLRFSNLEQANAEHLRLRRVYDDLGVSVNFVPHFRLELQRLEAEIALQAGDLRTAERVLEAHSRDLDEASDFVKRNLDEELALERLAGQVTKLDLLHRQQAGFDAMRSHFRTIEVGLAYFLQRTGRLKGYLLDQANEVYVDAALRAGEIDAAQEVMAIYDTLAKSGIKEESEAIMLLRARLEEATARDKRADATYRRLIERLRERRVDLPVDDTYLQAQKRSASAYEHYKRFLLRKGRLEEALAVVEEVKARTLLRNLAMRSGDSGEAEGTRGLVNFQRLTWKRYALARSLELATGAMRKSLLHQYNRVNTEFQASYLAVVPGLQVAPTAATFEAVLNSLSDYPGKVLVLDLDREGDRLYQWVIAGGKVVFADARATPVFELVATARAFTEAIAFGDEYVNDGGTLKPLAVVAEGLGRLLLSSKNLPDGSRVTIVAPPELQSLPFASLHLEGVPVVVKKFDAISMASSLRTLTSLPRRPDDRYRRVAFLGAWEPPPGAEPITYLDADASFFDAEFSIAGATRTIVTEPEQLIVDKVREVVSSHDLIQIYFHGLLDAANPMQGHLLLPSGERVYGYQMFEWRINAADIVLAACEVGAYTTTEAGDIVGPTFPLLVAGARSIVHSVWPANQKLASRLLRTMTTALANGVDPASALVIAQRELIAHQDDIPVHQRVRGWAAWRVVGRGQ